MSRECTWLRLTWYLTGRRRFWRNELKNESICLMRLERVLTMVVRACNWFSWMSVVLDKYLTDFITFTCYHRPRQVINGGTLCAGCRSARSGREKAQVSVFTIIKVVVIELAFWKNIWIYFSFFSQFILPATAKRVIIVENCILFFCKMFFISDKRQICSKCSL